MKKLVLTALNFAMSLAVFAQYEKDKDETKEKGFSTIKTVKIK